jgi:chloramphenicol-sensitive protein RarD
MDRRGLLHGVLAYGIWGLPVPLFWHLLADLDPYEVLAHRAVWGVLAFYAIAALAGQRRAVAAAMREPRTLAAMALSSALLCINWGTFVVAIATDRLLEASLGYFINPLVSVALGTVVLRERLRPAQWIAVGLAGVGVGVATYLYGEPPWIALILAGSFGSYGLVRKTARVDALVGSTVETALAAPVALAYLAWLAADGRLAFGHADAGTELLLVSTGFVTAIPLVLFTSAAKRLPLSAVGFLQYITPTGQFLVAIFAFGEQLAAGRLFAFAWIWAGLIVFTADVWRVSRRVTPAPGSPAPKDR